MYYDIGERLEQRIKNDYQYHAPFGDQTERYQKIRDAAKFLAVTIAQCSPESREQSVAFTALDQVVMMANAAIARNEKEERE